MARALTLRLDDETDAALQERKRERPDLSTAEIIREAIAERGSCVYFVRRSDGAVKIGYTAALRSRLHVLRSAVGDVVLEAVVPGGHDEEVKLHAKHVRFRVGGEWFRGLPVEREIRRLRAEWGVPDAHDWPPGNRFVRFTFLMSKREKRDLERLARKTGLTVSDMIRQLVRKAVEGLDVMEREGRRGSV